MNVCISNNEGIRSFFEGTSEAYIPISEMIYLHTHPLVTPNFITEVMKEVDSLSGYIPTETQFTELSNFAISIGTKLPVVDTSNAESILKDLRGVYLLAKSIKASKGVS